MKENTLFNSEIIIKFSNKMGFLCANNITYL